MESPNELAWRDAWDYCKSLGEGWRLPNSEELRKILVDDTAGARKNVKYWSSWHYGGYEYLAFMRRRREINS